MKRLLAVAGAALLLVLSPPAAAAYTPPLMVNGISIGSEAMATVWDNTTYVSLRVVSNALDQNAVVSWENNAAYVYTNDLVLSARPGDYYITVNGERVSVPSGVRFVQNRTLVPIRTLAKAFGATVYWSPINGAVTLVTDTANNYNEDDLYWLSRIISAESRGESLDGKIAVGNVVLNRVASSEFPNTIYGVIFDDRWGGQFEPVRNGTIYQTPTEESILAAKLCLDGADVIGDSLYFLAPALAQNFWVPQNKEYVATIGCHDFYK